jgi:type II secretory pathway pseudopilin PulG
MNNSPMVNCKAARGRVSCGADRAACESAVERQAEQGWALLALILFLAIMGIMMVGIVPNVQLEVRRDKEEEMIFRGQEMAEGIARYYNLGRPGPIGLSVPPPYGYLTDLKKLSEGVTLGTTDIKFVRGSAMTDPMVNKDWVPVRARDPRLMPMLQAYAAATLTTIPPQYMALAAAPVKTHFLTDTPAGGNGAIGAGQSGATSGNAQIGAQPSGDSGQTGAPGVNGGNGQPGNQNRGTQRAGTQPGKKTDGDDDDDDDDDDTSDPLSHLLKNEPNNLPIVGVAPNIKGPCVHPLYGITRYEQWVFIYLPPTNLPILPGQQPGLQPGQQPGQRVPLNPRPPRVSQ